MLIRVGNRILLRGFKACFPLKSFTTVATESKKVNIPYLRSLGVFTATAVGLWIYYRWERERYTEKLRQKRETLGLSESSGSYGKVTLGGPFELTDHHGQPFFFPQSLSKYSNSTKPFSLIYFGFTHCPDVCPEELEKISSVMRKLEEEEEDAKIKNSVIPIFITCDPERDGPAEIAEYLKDFHPSFVGLTGNPENVKQVAKKWRVYYRPAKTNPPPSSSPSNSTGNDYLVDHSIFYYLMDGDGNFLAHFGRDTTAQQCADKIREHLSFNKE